MDLSKIIRTYSTEQRSFEYLSSQIQETNEIQCPSCNSTEYYLMNPKRLLKRLEIPYSETWELVQYR